MSCILLNLLQLHALTSPEFAVVKLSISFVELILLKNSNGSVPKYGN